MNTKTSNVALSVETQDSAIIGCISFGGITFIMAAIIVLLQNDAAHAITMLVNG